MGCFPWIGSDRRKDVLVPRERFPPFRLKTPIRSPAAVLPMRNVLVLLRMVFWQMQVTNRIWRLFAWNCIYKGLDRGFLFLLSSIHPSILRSGVTFRPPANFAFCSHEILTGHSPGRSHRGCCPECGLPEVPRLQERASGEDQGLRHHPVAPRARGRPCRRPDERGEAAEPG